MSDPLAGAVRLDKDPLEGATLVQDPALMASSPGLYGKGPESKADAPDQSWGQFMQRAAPTVAGLALTPVGGGLAGMAAKKAIPGIGSAALKAATYAGESVGSLATMGVDKGIKGEAPTAGETGVYAALPMLGRGLGSMLGAVYRTSRHLIPGHGVGEQAYVIDEAKKNLGKAVKYGDYESGYDSLRGQWGGGNIESIPLPGTAAGAQKESARVALLIGELRKGGANKLADTLEQVAAGGSAPLNELHENMSQLGKLTGSGSKDLASGARYFYNLLQKDLARAGGPQSQELLGANREYSRKIMQDDINTLLNRATKADNVDPRVAQFRPGMLSNPIKSPSSRAEERLSSNFNERLTPQEKDYFWQELGRLGKFSPATTSDPFSWKRRIPAGMAAAALGGAGGGAVGGPFGIGAGMAFGVGIEEALANLMRTPSGKKLIRSMIEARGNNRAFSALGTGIGAGAMSTRQPE